MAKAQKLFMGIMNGEHPHGGSPEMGMVHVGTEFADVIAVEATHGMPDKTKVRITYNDGNVTDQGYKPDFAVTGDADEVDAEGWVGTVLKRSDIDASHDHEMTVYTDVGATAGPPFSQSFPVDSAGAYVLHVDAGTPLGTHDFNIVSDPFTNTNFISHSFNMDDGSDLDSDPDNYVGHRGTYAGAPGEYRCTAILPATTAGCTSRLDSLGYVQLGGADSKWVFVPDTGATTMLADSSYLYFGWWLRENLNAVSATTGLAVRTFYGSSADNVYQLNVDVTGTAEFAGAAAGKVALIDHVAGTADGGHWTADAALTVDFGDGATAGTVSGTIDNFMTGDTERDWSVALLPATLIPNTATGAAAPDYLHFDTTTLTTPTPFVETDAEVGEGTIWTIGSGDAARASAASGDYWGTLYGTTFVDVGGVLTETHTRNDGTPTSAGGEFFTQFGEAGKMVGAFGVNSTTNDSPSK